MEQEGTSLMEPTGAAPLRPTDLREIGPYRLLGRLGEGGMGTVFLAKAPTGRFVAVKVVRAEFANQEGFAARFHGEVENARRVASFCTAQVLDNGNTSDGRPYMVTEYIAGIPLSGQISQYGALDQGPLHGVALGVAAALAAIHIAGLVHRDLKPANVILSLSGPRVIDFGIARALDRETGFTMSGELLGSPGWWAPEQVRGENVTPAADIFAWGCLIAYAGNGRHPFGRGDAITLATRVLHTTPDLGVLPAPLNELVRLATSMDPVHRPTAQDLLIALVGGAAPAPAAPAADPPTLVADGLLTDWEPPQSVVDEPDITATFTTPPPGSTKAWKSAPDAGGAGDGAPDDPARTAEATRAATPEAGASGGGSAKGGALAGAPDQPGARGTLGAQGPASRKTGGRGGKSARERKAAAKDELAHLDELARREELAAREELARWDAQPQALVQAQAGAQAQVEAQAQAQAGAQAQVEAQAQAGVEAQALDQADAPTTAQPQAQAHVQAQPRIQGQPHTQGPSHESAHGAPADARPEADRRADGLDAALQHTRPALQDQQPPQKREDPSTIPGRPQRPRGTRWLIAAGAAVLATAVTAGILIVTSGRDGQTPIRTQSGAPPSQRPNDLGRRFALGPAFDDPQLIVATAPTCGLKEYDGRRPAQGQLCTVRWSMINPGGVRREIGSPVVTVLDDRGARHDPVTEATLPDLIVPGGRIDRVFVFDLPLYRKPVKLAATLLKDGRQVEVRLP